MPIRVMIADDHNLVREGTRGILEQREDITVVAEAADGEQAVRAVTEGCPDVILMDVAMPRVNGIEATRRCKAICPATAVLALTAYDNDPYVLALLEAGAAGYLLKSIPSEELVRAVRAVHAGEPVLSPSVARKLLGRLVKSRGVDSSSAEEPLTDREREVLLLAAKGLTNKEIARQVSLSPRTVQFHLNQIFAKLKVASRMEAVMDCLRRGWLQMEDLA